MIRVLLLHLVPCWVNRATGKDTKRPCRSRSSWRCAKLPAALINKHYRRLRLPKEYAKLLYITPNHLNALSQTRSGKTAGELICGTRAAARLKRLLTNEGLIAMQIASDLNFEDNSTSRAF